MASISLSINLTKLDGARLQTANDGKLYVCIPVEEADLFMTEKGACYLSLNAWDNGKVDQYGNSHAVKQSFSKARREQLGPDGVKNKPYIGNGKNIQPRNTNASGPYQQTTPPIGFQESPSPFSAPQNDDMAF